MSDAGLTSQFLELSSALQRRATFVQRSDHKAQIAYVADLLDRSAQNLQPISAPSKPYQPRTPLGEKVDLSV